jgi:chorismate-pyruvate lyase
LRFNGDVFNGSAVGPSGLEKALGGAGGTVTACLEQLVGEPIDAQVGSQETVVAPSSNGLGVEAGHPLLARSATLRGRRSGRSFVYAETILVPSRLSDGFLRRLGSSRDPIGRILEEEGIAVTREPLSGPDGSTASASDRTGSSIGECLLARTYRVDAAGAPVMVISEWFLTSLEKFLSGR